MLLEAWVPPSLDDTAAKRIRLFVGLLISTLPGTITMAVSLQLYLGFDTALPVWILLFELFFLLAAIKSFPERSPFFYRFHLLFGFTHIGFVACLLPPRAVIYCTIWITVFPLLAIFLLGPKPGFRWVMILAFFSTLFSTAYQLNYASNIEDQLSLVETAATVYIFTLIIATSSYFFFNEMQIMQHNITRQRMQLKESETIVHQSTKWAAIGEIAHGVAHEINNPLTIALLNNDFLQKRNQDNSNVQHHSAKIETS